MSFVSFTGFFKIFSFVNIIDIGIRARFPLKREHASSHLHAGLFLPVHLEQPFLFWSQQRLHGEGSHACTHPEGTLHREDEN